MASISVRTADSTNLKKTLRSKAIKGPGLKLDLDVRRVWECPACGRRVKRDGSLSSYQCRCQESPVFMRLVEDQRAERPYEPYIVPEIDADELVGDEEPASTDLPAEEQPATVVEIVTPGEDATPITEDVVSANTEISEPVPERETMDEPADSAPAVESGSVENSTPESPSGKKPRKGRSRKRRGRKRKGKSGSEGSGQGE